MMVVLFFDIYSLEIHLAIGMDRAEGDSLRMHGSVGSHRLSNNESRTNDTSRNERTTPVNTISGLIVQPTWNARLSRIPRIHGF